YWVCPHQCRCPFPTRRSSDLVDGGVDRFVKAPHPVHVNVGVGGAEELIAFGFLRRRKQFLFRSLRYLVGNDAFFLQASLQNLKRSEEHTSELQSRFDLVCRLL